MSYSVGQQLRFRATFRDNAGTLVAPTTVVFKLRDPDGTVTTGTVTNDSTGLYHALHTLDAAGVWRWRWESTGKAAAVEGQLTARTSF